MQKIILPIVVIALFVVGFFAAQGALKKIGPQTASNNQSTTTVLENDKCGEECQRQISNAVSKAIATLSATPKVGTIVPGKISNIPTPKPQDSYIQISGSGSTKNVDWTDVPGTDFSFDVNQDFSSGAHFAWEGFLRIADANGTAYARIYDVTHKIGVDGSQISVSGVADYTRANSINMNFWSGRNVYRVQIKSLNTLNVDYMGGKIRVSY